MPHEIKIVAAVLAHIRGELTAAHVADMFGVTEAQVHAWKDIFQVAGVVALMNALTGGGPCDPDPSPAPGEPTSSTTTPHP